MIGTCCIQPDRRMFRDEADYVWTCRAVTHKLLEN
jgi:hypothetical protein